MPQFVNMSRCVLQEFKTTEPPATQPKHASQNGYMIIHVSAQSCKHIYIYQILNTKYIIIIYNIYIYIIFIYMLYIYFVSYIIFCIIKNMYNIIYIYIIYV